MRRWISTGLVALLAAGVVCSCRRHRRGEAAWAPNRPVQLICPWAAGGGTDRIARMVGILLEKEIGQPVTVVNRTGGSGAVGHTAGATATPDGHTITIVTVELAMMHWMGLTPLTYREFTPDRPGEYRRGRRPGGAGRSLEEPQGPLGLREGQPRQGQGLGDRGRAGSGTWLAQAC